MTKEEKKESTELKDTLKNTSCYTYEVTMLIQVIAPTKEIADAKLDQDGGYISKRKVDFKFSTLLHEDKEAIKKHSI
jgi:hypothetical protein